MTSNWWSSRYVGKTGTSSAVGATRATSFCSTGFGRSAAQRAVRMMVSDDMPVESTPLSTVTSGVTPPGSTVDNHRDIRRGTVAVSRLERCSAADIFDRGFIGHRCFLREVITIR